MARRFVWLLHFASATAQACVPSSMSASGRIQPSTPGTHATPPHHHHHTPPHHHGVHHTTTHPPTSSDASSSGLQSCSQVHALTRHTTLPDDKTTDRRRQHGQPKLSLARLGTCRKEVPRGALTCPDVPQVCCWPGAGGSHWPVLCTTRSCGRLTSHSPRQAQPSRNPARRCGLTSRPSFDLDPLLPQGAPWPGRTFFPSAARKGPRERGFRAWRQVRKVEALQAGRLLARQDPQLRPRSVTRSTALVRSLSKSRWKFHGRLILPLARHVDPNKSPTGPSRP